LEEIVRLRGHHILCLLGFRGLGYDEEFVANMTRVHSRVFLQDCLIELVTGPDDICSACPRLEKGCKSVKEKDSKVLRLLNLQPSEQVESSEIFTRVAKTIKPDDLEHICPRCRWRSLGYCAEGIETLISMSS
jgi:hypothetical protein